MQAPTRFQLLHGVVTWIVTWIVTYCCMMLHGGRGGTEWSPVEHETGPTENAIDTRSEQASKRASEQLSKRAKWHPCIYAFMFLRAYVGKAHRGQARHDVTRVAAKERGKGQECIYAAKHLRTYAGKARKGRPVMT